MQRQPHFCLECFALIPAEAQVCPHCGKDQERLRQKDYRAKLLHALQHPLSEVRMRAIIALGWQGEPDAASDLVECALRHPIDVVEGLEIVRSLARIESRYPGRGALERLMAQHPAHAVQEAAMRALAAGAPATERKNTKGQESPWDPPSKKNPP